MNDIKRKAWKKSYLENIKKALPEGWADSLAVEFELSADTVRNMMRGVSTKDAVVFKAIDMAKEYQALRDKKMKEGAAL